MKEIKYRILNSHILELKKYNKKQIINLYAQLLKSDKF